MYIDFTAETPSQRYFTMTQSVLPRPIAWVLSDNGDANTDKNSYNLAPFSYFNAICSDPPLLMISIGHKPNGDDKDTAVNIGERKQFVVHIPHREQAAMVTETSRTLAHGDSELDRVGLKLVEFQGFDLPRLADCRLAYACELYQVQHIGNGPHTLIFGEIKTLYVDEAVVVTDANGRRKLNAAAIDPLARLGSSEYGVLGQILDIPRPK